MSIDLQTTATENKKNNYNSRTNSVSLNNNKYLTKEIN